VVRGKTHNSRTSHPLPLTPHPFKYIADFVRIEDNEGPRKSKKKKEKGRSLMQITCLGAARCVTGSSFLIDRGRKYLVDCGLFQGGRQMEALNRAPWGFDPADIDALFLTHAHIDHCGRIPRLVKDGFRGRIYSSVPTVELTKILLLDSAHIQEMEAEWQTRKNKRRGDPLSEPLYRLEDAEACFAF
jgi:metallo-beta-lactamase family protein